MSEYTEGVKGLILFVSQRFIYYFMPQVKESYSEASAGLEHTEER